MDSSAIIEQYFDFLQQKDFPCVAARAAVDRDQVKCMVARHMGCPVDDHTILQFLYSFIDQYRLSEKPFHSAAILFTGPVDLDETSFDSMLWTRLNSLSALDRQQYKHDPRVDADPDSPRFSYSLKEEAFFIIGLNPASKRLARKFQYPALVFNPHAEFEKLRSSHKYEAMKKNIRRRDNAFSGSVNPMLDDFGESSEVFQYSGMQYPENWKCPLKK